MNPTTGEIRKFPSKPDADRAGFTLPLTPEQATAFEDLPLEARLAAYRNVEGPLPASPVRKFKKRVGHKKKRADVSCGKGR